MDNSTYVTRPASPAIPAAPKTRDYPELHWSGEEKFRVWHVPRIEAEDRNRGVVRDYYVFGIRGWRSGPFTARLNLARHFRLRLIVNDDKKMWVEAEVLLSRVSAARAKVAEPERGLVVTFQLSKPEDDAEVRLLRRHILRLAVWADKRLGQCFEDFLAHQGL